jgi:predicted nuclease of restriction endonuclease-like (RecB) superfamily
MNKMKQFYETYESDEQHSALARVLLWTHNTNDTASCECASVSPPKLTAALRVLQPAMGEAFKDHYVLEFLGLPDPHSENGLKRALVRHLKAFVLELGKDFLFVSEEYRLQVGNQDFYIDLLFYHRNLSALVVFELKIGQFKPEHMGQLNFYLEALDRDVKKPHENPSMGVLLCRDKDDEVVEYALSRNLSPALVAQYQLQLPDKKLLRSKLHELLAQEWGVGHEK